jgi:threonine synthase
VGVHVAEEHLGATPVVTLATAHPAKFPSAVEAASGVFPGLPQRMADLFEREERITRVTGSVSDIKTIIKDRI